MFTWFGPSKATLRAEIARLIDERNKAQLQVIKLEKRAEQNEMQVQIIKLVEDREIRALQKEIADTEERHKKEIERTNMKMLMLCTSDDSAIKQAIVDYKTRAMQVALLETLGLDPGSRSTEEDPT